MEPQVFSESLPLADLLVRSAVAHPDHVALALPDAVHTYADLLAGAQHAARFLVAAGVQPGDTVGLLAPNSAEMANALFGTAMIGAVSVPLNPRLRSRELGYIIRHAELAALIVSDALAPRTDLPGVLAQALPGLNDADPRIELALEGAPRLRRVAMLTGPGAPGILSGEQVEDLGASCSLATVERARHDVRVRDDAMVIYTSGTTADPKGCVLSHEAVSRGPVGRTSEAVPFVEPREQRVLWSPAPLFHVAALQGFIYSIATGLTFVTDTYLDGERALRAVRHWRPTSLWPMFMSVMTTLLEAPGFTDDDLGQATSIVTVGSADDLRLLQARFPHATLVNGSGMSEMAGHFCLSAPSDSIELRATTSGRPVQGVRARVVDPITGLDQPDDGAGELLLKGYAMFLRYLKDEERTAQAVDVDGWLHTGDLFRKYSSGHLRYEGRLKDMIKVGGENVTAIEVEEFLCTHPQIVSAQVVARPDSRLDEVAVAYVQVAKGRYVTAEEVIAYCKDDMASFKVPRAVYFISEGQWPMSATKINKAALRRDARTR